MRHPVLAGRRSDEERTRAIEHDPKADAIHPTEKDMIEAAYRTNMRKHEAHRQLLTLRKKTHIVSVHVWSELNVFRSIVVLALFPIFLMSVSSPAFVKHYKCHAEPS